MARAALKDIQIFNPYVNQNGSFNAYSYYDHGVESQENFRNAFPVTDQCERSAQLMGDDYVRLKFNLTAYVPMAAFSFIRYDGQTFFLMNDYCPHSNGSRMEHDQQGNEMVVSDSYEYDMKFYSVANMLRKPICYRHVKVANGATAADGYHEWDEPEVTVSATLETMYVIIVQSIEQYTSRLDSDFLLTRMLATIPTNGLDNTGIAPKNTVKLTAGTELATFNFNGEKIADVCTAVANTYSDAKKETEWYIEEDAEHSLTLHFCKCVDTGSMNHADDFSYKKTEGVDRYTKPIKTGGLKKVDYSRDESNIPQVIIPFGSERNMTYQAVKGIDEVSQMQSTFGKRLRLKTNHTCTIDDTQYPTAAMQAKGMTGAYAVTDKDGNTVPLGVDAHGGIANDKVNTGVENVEYFDDVYPQCHFQVSKVDVRNKKKDGATIPEYTCEGKVVNAQGQEIQPEGDFYPIQIEEGTTLSVRFESGYLNGREFEIANKTSKKADDGSMQTNYTLRFVIVADGSIEDGTLIPSGNFKPNVGDKFALFNMKMPEAYITYAQEELAQKAYEKLMEYQNTVPDVKCTSDPDSFSGKDVYFGAQYTINSEKLGFTLNAQNRRVPIDFISRVVAYSYKLTKVNDVSFTLSSALVRGVLSEMAAAITNVSYATDSLGQRSINLSRRGWRDASEVADMITGMTTEMMLVGNEKYQFQYTSEILPLHTNGVFTGLKVSYGQLQHTQQPYIDYANGGMWQIEPNASLNEDHQGNALDGTKPYYVFALCGTDSLDWATVILMDKDAAEAAGVYRKDAEISDQDAYPEYLLLGILSSEFAEEKNGQMTYERVFSPTNGFTAIEGGTITTEQIQDANRQLIIDFLSMPPRIIARGGAEIIGNITFKSFKDESGNNVLETLGRNLIRDTAFTKKAVQSDPNKGLVGWTFYNPQNSPQTGKTLNGGSFTTHEDDNTVDVNALRVVMTNKEYVEDEETKVSNNRIMLTQTGATGWNSPNDTYTFSAVVKAASATAIYFGAGYAEMATQYGASSVGTSYSKIQISIKVPSGTEIPSNYGVFFLRLADGETNTLTFKEVKLEKGVIGTTWTKAPEDTVEEIQENKLYIEAVEQDLQNQIDGVVDSYFMEGVPTMQNAPASDWSEDEYQRHEGDTYTNIQNHNTLDVTQWEQGRVYYGTNYTNVGKTLDQCKSANTDANHANGYRCKGLIEYKAGDTLLLNTNGGAFDVLITYYDDNGIHVADAYYSGAQHTTVEEVALNASYTKCNISIRKSSAVTGDDVRSLGLCINPTAGHSWRFCNSEGTGWHWHEIADSDAVKALQDAAAAQDTADGKRRVFTVQPVPPYDAGDLWANAYYPSSTQSDSNTYNNVLLKCKTPKAKGQSFTITDWEDSSRAIASADAAQAAADDAMQKALDIADDGIISGGTEKSTLLKEWQEIAGSNYNGTSNGSYYKATTQANDYGLTYDTLTTAFNALSAAMAVIRQNTNADTYLNGTTPPAGASILNMTKADFIALWRTYYDAEIALLNAVSDVIDTREIGGENILYVKEYYNNLLTCEEGNVDSYYEELTYYSGSGASRQHTYYPAGKYVFSANDVFTEVTDFHAYVRLYIAAFNSSGQEVAAVLIPAGTLSNRASVRDVLITTNASCYFCLKIVCDGTKMLQYCQGSAKASNMQLQKGVKSTSYNNYMEHLSNAIKGTTDINGGLVMLNVLMLKNEQGHVTAGMSGLQGTSQNPEIVLMWGGATYQQALNAALHDYFLNGTSGDLITTLLKKDGTGKIGCFQVVDKNTVKVMTGNNEIIITTNSIAGYISTFTTKTLSITDTFSVNNDDEHNEDISLGSLGTVPAGKFAINTPKLGIDFKLSFRKGTSQMDFSQASLTVWYVELVLKSGGNDIATFRLIDAESDPIEPAVTVITPGSGDGYTHKDVLAQEFNFTNDTSRSIGMYLRFNCAGSYHAATDGSASNSIYFYDNDTSTDKVKVREVKRVTVLGQDGMAVSIDSSATFYVYNNGPKLDIRASGLPNRDGAEAGGFYLSGESLCIKPS